VNPSTKLSPDFRPNTLIDNKSFKEIVNNFKDDIERTLENCQLLYIESTKFAVSFSKEAAGYNLIKNIREMWDYEILIDACIDALPIGKQTNQMQSWVPYPMTDKGASYMAYKKARFNSSGNLGIYVNDELVLELFSNDPIKPIKKDNKGMKQTNANKGGRPTDAKIKRKIDKLRTRYYDLRDNQGLSKTDSLKKLKKEFPDWTLSTIETYLKK